jgi:hypothetical protein
MSPDGKTHNKIYHILKGRRRYSSVLDVRWMRAAYYEAIIWWQQKLGRLTVNKQRSHRFRMERLILRS